MVMIFFNKTQVLRDFLDKNIHISFDAILDVMKKDGNEWGRVKCSGGKWTVMVCHGEQ